MHCKNCFAPIPDLRKETKCETCSSALHKDCAIKDDGAFYCDVCYTVKEENGVTVTQTIPDEIRRTYIETYRTCPYKFLKEVVEGHEQPPTIYTQLGIDLHELFEECSNQYMDKEVMVKRFEKTFGEYPIDLFKDKTRDEMWLRAVTSIDTFYETLRELPVKPFVTEEQIAFNIGDELPKVRFTMDRIDEVDGELEMHDWKTGKTLVGKKISTDLQAPIYLYGSRLHYNKPIRSFTFHYLNEKKKRIFTRSPIDPNVYECVVRKRVYKINLQDGIREVQHIFSQIVKGNFNVPVDTKKMYFACKTCHIKEMGMCEGADIESWKQKSTGVGW